MNESNLYPLRFSPIFRRYLWGGRRLETQLGKSLGDGEDYAESWEVVDHGADQSLVSYGPLAGQSLQQVCMSHAQAIYGRHAARKRFPLLFKFLDAHRALSVQVHPNDEEAARLDPPDLGKTEAWVVLHAEPESKIFAGLRPGVTREQLADALAGGSVEQCLHVITPAVGDCIFIPAGTVHALGAGLVIAEIQQASDTTFRLWDWNRLGADGKSRELHIEQALAVIDFAAGPVAPQKPIPLGEGAEESAEPRSLESGSAECLVSCEKFVMTRWRLSGPSSLVADNRFHLLVVLEGALRVKGDPAGEPVKAGQVALVPAERPTSTDLQPSGKTTLLDICLP